MNSVARLRHHAASSPLELDLVAGAERELVGRLALAVELGDHPDDRRRARRERAREEGREVGHRNRGGVRRAAVAALPFC